MCYSIYNPNMGLTELIFVCLLVLVLYNICRQRLKRSRNPCRPRIPTASTCPPFPPRYLKYISHLMYIVV